MSASAILTSAASGRPFLLPAQWGAVCARLGAARLPAVTPASRLEVRAAPEMVSSGIRELDLLTGGLPRGCLTEICGPASSGRTGILLSALAQATRRGEACALIDAGDVLDPASAAAAGIVMERFLWVRCGKKNPRTRNSPARHGNTQQPHNHSQPRPGDSEKANRKFGRNSPGEMEIEGEEKKVSEQRLEQVLKVTDLLLQSNGFGMIALDLGDIPVRSARRISLASWFRFRRAVEHTPTVLLVIEQQPIAGSCSSVLVKVAGNRPERKPSALPVPQATGSLTHSELLDQFEITAELLRSRLERKPSQSVVSFSSRAKWAG